MSWLDPRSRTQIRMIRHFKRLRKLPEHRLTKKIFLWDRSLNDSGRIKTWSFEVKEILCRNNIDYVYDSPYFCIQNTVKDLEKSLLDKDRTKWEADSHRKPKLRTFVIFKDFKNETSYLFKPLSFVQRKSLAKLRLGVLTLRIETGRFVRPRLPAEERLCLICNSGEVEDEAHFLLRCETYRVEMQHLFEKIEDPVSFALLPDKKTLQTLLNDPDFVKTTSQFIVDSFDRRSLYI